MRRDAAQAPQCGSAWRVRASARGLVVCNPPYDARLSADPALYRALGGDEALATYLADDTTIR